MNQFLCVYIPNMTPNIRLETIKNAFKTMGDVKYVYFEYDVKRQNSKAAFVYITLYKNIVNDFNVLINSEYGFQIKPYGNSNPYIVWEVLKAINIPISCERIYTKYSLLPQLEEIINECGKMFI
jgi:hypothetical protein